MPSVYRYDDANYAPGQIIVSRGDHIHGLTGKQRAAEEAIRNVSPEWDRIRSQSLYVWRDKDVAETLWRKTVKPYHLYELALDVADIEHVGDVFYFTMLENAVNTGLTAADYALRAYTQRPPARPYVEILVKKATVVQKVFDVSQK